MSANGKSLLGFFLWSGGCEYHGPRECQSLSAQFKRIWYKLRGTGVPEPISPVWPFDTPKQLEAARHEVSRP